jgi:predicted TIM-barrel fold metal-dependent hydrolase
LAERNLHFELHIYAAIQVREAVALAMKFPTTQIVINHCGMPLDRDAASIVAWRTAITQLAACTNVWIKISGLGMCDNKWTLVMASPYSPHHVHSVNLTSNGFDNHQ